MSLIANLQQLKNIKELFNNFSQNELDIVSGVTKAIKVEKDGYIFFERMPAK
jgi:hypothetical protein